MNVNRLATFRAHISRITQGPFDRRALLLIGAGLVVALAGLVIMLATGSAAAPAGSQANLPAQTVGGTPAAQAAKSTRPVVMAAVDIGAGKVITAAQLRVLDYPADLVPPDALGALKEAVGSVPSVPIFSGQIVLRRQLEALPPALGGGTAGPIKEIPEDKVLAAFPATDLLNSTGTVRAGDHVDVYLSMPVASPVAGGKVAQVTLQNVLVFNVGYWQPVSQAANSQGQAAPGAPGSGQAVSGVPLTAGRVTAPSGGTGGPSVVTFVLSPQDALVLKYMKDSGGTIDMVVRSPSNSKKTSTEPVDSQYMIDHYGFKR